VEQLVQVKVVASLILKPAFQADIACPGPQKWFHDPATPAPAVHSPFTVPV